MVFLDTWFFSTCYEPFALDYRLSDTFNRALANDLYSSSFVYHVLTMITLGYQVYHLLVILGFL